MESHNKKVHSVNDENLVLSTLASSSFDNLVNDYPLTKEKLANDCPSSYNLSTDRTSSAKHIKKPSTNSHTSKISFIRQPFQFEGPGSV